MKKLSIGDVQTLVSASFTSAIPKSAPSEIVYIPVGSSTITPSVNGKPQKVTVNVPAEKGDEIAARMQKALERRLAGPVRPRLAFDHLRTGPASGHPESFRFGTIETPDGPKTGIILKANWSFSGKSAIEGGDYGYFSPAFLMDDRGEPVGLSDKGEIGSLVDEPAFREIGLIAASDMSYVGAKESPWMQIASAHAAAEPIKPDPTLTNQEKTMPKQILAALNISDTAADAEGAAVVAVNAMKSEITSLKASDASKAKEIEDLTKQVKAHENTIKEQAEKRADDLIQAAVTDGRILPKDEDSKSFYREAIVAGNASAEKILAGLPVLNKDLANKVVTASKDNSTPAGEHKFVTAAKALVTSKEADTIEAAYGIVAQKDPSLYEDFRAVLA